jgi:hypothetical protein
VEITDLGQLDRDGVDGIEVERRASQTGDTENRRLYELAIHHQHPPIILERSRAIRSAPGELVHGSGSAPRRKPDQLADPDDPLPTDVLTAEDPAPGRNLCMRARAERYETDRERRARG